MTNQKTTVTVFQKKLLNEFKFFVYEKTSHLELDFRTHVYLDNQYGLYPSYNYSIAETVVECIFSFFDRYNIDYSGRYNKDMMIESLRINKLNNFIIETLTNEIE